MRLAGLIILLASVSAVAQDFTIKKVNFEGGKIVLQYDLVDSISRSYTINVYSSSDNFINPLKEVSGDVGLEIKPGGNRTITWDATKELGAGYVGEMALEVRGKVYIPFVKLDGFEDYRKFKRRSTYKITWTGGRGNSVLSFDLYRGDVKVTTYPNVANVGQYDLRLGNVKPGKYRLKVSDARNKDDVVYSQPFKIRRRIPLALKAAVVGGVGFALYSLWPQGEQDIPDPKSPK